MVEICRSGGSVKHTGDKPYIANARFTDEIEFDLPKNNSVPFSQNSGTNLKCEIVSILIPYTGNLCNRGIHLMQDGAPCHSARTTMALLQANGVNVLPRSSRSPDLN